MTTTKVASVLKISRICAYAWVMCCVCIFSSVLATNITYLEDLTDFPNPERGFWGGTVSKKYIYLETQATLSSTFLSGVEKTFNDVRNTKKKIVPRFFYKNGDVSVDVMLKHMDQLKPLFEKHYDVIAVLEAGFNGEWGEWHSSNNIKTADQRKQILFKLLDVLPKERMVALRYNYYKREIFASDAPITLAEAFNGSNKSRTGAMNDCFVTNEHDAGTYHVPPWEYKGLGVEKEKEYLSADNLYVPQTGETCQVGSVSFASCTRALADMARMRWDMIRTGWYEPVLSQWKSQGCWDEMSRRLGYRIVLVNGTFDDDVTDGNLDATIELKNVGFGKIYNPRKIEMVLRNTANNTEYVLPIASDPRFWSPGMSHKLTMKIGIPKTVPFGNYSLYLSLRDPAPGLYAIPEYAIRLANKDMWDAAKGYNSLKQSVKINSHNNNIVSVKYSGLTEKVSGIKAAQVTAGFRSVDIRFSTSRPARVQIDVHDLSGKLVNGLVNSYFGAGEHRLTWNRCNRSGSVQPAGMYFVTLRTEGVVDRRQVIVK